MNGLHLILLIQLGLTFIHAVVELDFSSCGTDKICEKRPQNCNGVSDCDTLVVSKQLDENLVEFEIFATKSNQKPVNYLALGFSDDQKMGGEGVTYCYNLDNGQKGVEIGHTVEKNFMVFKAGIQDIVELKEISVDDTQFYCKFTQKVNKGSNDLLKPDLSKPYHLLVVRGTADEKTSLHIHDMMLPYGPFSSGRVGLLNAQTSDGSVSTQNKEADSPSKDNLLKRLHGALMLLAWFGFVFSAVYSARHLKELWPNTTVSGMQIWFHIHRLLNVTGVTLIVIAAILIFIGVEYRWTGPRSDYGDGYSTSAKSIHSLIGLISVILAVFQPFMALMRCDKHSPKRPIFNVFHRSFGLLGLLLAVIAIAIAIFGNISELWKDNSAMSILLGAFLAFLIIVIIAQELLRLKQSREHNKVTSIELQSRRRPSSDSYYYKNTTDNSTRYRHLTLILFVTFGSIAFIVSILLAYLVLSTS